MLERMRVILRGMSKWVFKSAIKVQKYMYSMS